MEKTTNVVIAGLGGQGVLKGSDILAEAAFRAGRDVKKSELHGMSQRGGSVRSDVRFGAQVQSPMITTGEADILVILEPTQTEVNRPLLRPDGVLLTPDLLDAAGTLRNRKSLNVAMLGMLSALLDLPEEHWQTAIQDNLAPKLHAVNEEAFTLGRQAAALRQS